MSFDKLQERIDKYANPSVAGLDPMPEYIPQFICERAAEEHGFTLKALAVAYLEFNKGLIDALCDIVPAVKPQSAYYERLGSYGIRTLEETVGYAKSKGMYVILDVKRNDIGSTASAYADAYLGTVSAYGQEFTPFGADAVTINAYLGSDGVVPFLDAASVHDGAVFVLVKTSNKSSGEFQDQYIGSRTVYTAVADRMAELSSATIGKYGFSRVGAVVGATYPDELRFLRGRLSHTFFLVPGYGAQGAGAEDIAPAFCADGHGAVINSSRAIMCAWQKTGGDYMESARAEAKKMRDALRNVAYKKT